ncbi:hypothetical protein [uncultured Clostridium sp.]|jgi:hypothetical protein|uniref:hypothetical protein n=1 Tax=uncultured Clostridium sp. TaxID=59620 RepID=UPI002606FA3D|nr:hypothetical protein [uncultured Clostridium sp.]
MLFKYNFKEFSSKNFYKRPILKSPFFIGLILLNILNYTSNKDLSMFLFLFAALIFNFLLDFYHYGSYMTDYNKHLIKFENELKLLDNANISLGATLHDDYMELAGVISYDTVSTRTQITHFEVYKQIHYCNISLVVKTKYTTYIDFLESTEKYPSTKRLFINYHFENSDILYKILAEKVYGPKETRKKSISNYF